MPTLTYSTGNDRYAGVLSGRVLIGRRLSHGVVLTDPSVSRLHAWIDPTTDQNAQWAVFDAGSTTGTFVNGQKITRQPLRDGDKIRVGKVTVTYRDADEIPADALPVELSSPTGVVKSAGILFECACGSPLWVGNELAGKRGMCRHCRKPVTVPAAEISAAPIMRSAAPPTPSPTIRRTTRCAVCHSAINDGESTTQCPDCAMTFHTECWQENLGCSSYGCPQVDALKPKEAVTAVVAETTPIQEPIAEEELPAPMQWDVILLAASVVGSLIGAVTFGTVAAVVAVASVTQLIRGKRQRPVLLILATVISVAGIAIGFGISDLFYFNARHIPASLMQR